MGTKVTWIDKKLYAKIKATLTPLLRDIPNDVLLHIAKGSSYSRAELTNWEITHPSTGEGTDAAMIGGPTLTWLGDGTPNNTEKLKVYYKNPHLVDPAAWSSPLDPKSKTDAGLYDSIKFTIRLFALNALRYREQRGTLTNHRGERVVKESDIDHAHYKLEREIENEFKTSSWGTFLWQFGRTAFYGTASLFLYAAASGDKEKIDFPLIGDYPASGVLKTAGSLTVAAGLEAGNKCKADFCCAFWYSGQALQKKVSTDTATIAVDVPHAIV